MPDGKGSVFISDVDRPKTVTLLRTGTELSFAYHDSALLVAVTESMRTPLPDMVKIVFGIL